MRRILSFLCILLLAPLSFAHEGSFSDIPEGHDFYELVQAMHDKGYIQGYEDGTIRLEAEISRVEFLKIGLLASGTLSPCTTLSTTYTDVDYEAWYAPFVLTATSCWIISGYPDQSFRPADPINFAEAAKMLTKMFDLEVPTKTEPEWYAPYTTALLIAGVSPGYTADRILTRFDLLYFIAMLEMDLSLDPHTSKASYHIPDYFASYDAVDVSSDASWWYIHTNGLPDHETGDFPNSGNPNTISEQDADYKITRYPEKTATPTEVQVPGIGFNGVFFEPGTAETWNNDRSSGWNYEALQDTLNLGLDFNNAHVQPTGAYHYHGTPVGLVASQYAKAGSDAVFVGLASDGFPIYVYRNNYYTSSYQLKDGTRPSGPGGVYDGTFTQDFEYVEGLGDLDQCNGVDLYGTEEYPDGTYAYIITSSFPYIPRCLYGTPDASFQKGPGAGMQPGGMGPPPGRRP